MARILVLSFKNNDAAEAVVKMLEDADDPYQTGWGTRASALGIALSSHARAEALIARPVAPCRHRFVKGQPWKKTERFGWYIHDVEGCRRPAATVVRDFIKNMLIASGNNLLPALRDSWYTAKEEDGLDPEETSQTTSTETQEAETQQGDFSENENSTG